MFCITADSDRVEWLVNRYGSPIAHRNSDDVGETSQVHSNRDFCRCDCFGPSFEIEISGFAVQFSFGIKRLLPFVPNGSMIQKGRKIVKYRIEKKAKDNVIIQV